MSVYHPCYFLFAVHFFFFHHITSAQISQSTDESISDSQDFWNLEGDIGLKLSQSAVSNWVPGGENFLAVYGLLDVELSFDDTVKHRWFNQFRLEYGITHQGGEKNIFIKNSDLLRFGSLYGRTLTKRLSLSASLTFNSQLAQGYKYVEIKTDSTFDIDPSFISEFMSPGFLEPSLGFTYLPVGQSAKDKNAWALMLFPISGKFTFVLNDDIPNRRNVPEGKKVRAEIGSRFSTTFNKEVMKNMTLQSNFIAFANFQKFDHVDLTFNTLVQMKVNKFIATDLSVDIVYDDDTIGKVQFRNLLNVGLSLKL